MNMQPKPILIDELLRDSVLIVVQLKQGASITSGSKLYQKCKDHIITVRETLQQAQYSQDVIDDISYALCALLDETVLLCHREDAHKYDYESWLGAPLQVVFFNTHNAGYTLFEKVRSRLRADKKEQLVLSCFDRVLGLGFQGCYLDQPQRERDHLILALREAVREYEQDQTHPIIEQVATHRYLGHKLLLLLLTGASVITAIILYFYLNHQLDLLITPLLG
ncbi:type VI secretion system protein TssL, short form [Candidatus Schmidhempelia bombi]|jgi:type VI secretion system protein ImpK|uniref:DotU family type IV/VI secretion system protein n=1 Tax=Candidatus Schmidhempelia bombi str. Bimp TaxID=1387197 RepID=A0AB94IBW9_9GAMM|nr:type VI secretion system protein TssL, short form [Candidatus Schmidhempelia bombi]TEA26903.1 DotU family type IV/VI secretion system protein [Candidatus Schmidhempelia bombi str. Bimp]